MRLDLHLVEKNFYPSRGIAQDSIKEGKVSVLVSGEWKIITKAGFSIDKHTKIKVQEESVFWVSRAAKKIAGAVESLNLCLKDRTVLDLGQSTGGFTQFFLHKGAASVVGVDVGKDQLHQSLREDNRVEFYEELDARHLSCLEGRSFDFFSADLSFISLLKVAPELKRLLGEQSVEGLFLVKPQFEVGRENVGRGGLVKEPVLLLECQKMVLEGLENLGYKVLDYLPSEVRGKDGNQEFICFVTT